MRRTPRRPFSLACAVVAALAATAPATAQEEAAAEEATPLRPEVTWRIEGKAHVRDSDENAFPVPFPFGDMLPPGAPPVMLRTVDPGTSVELSTVTLTLDAAWGEGLLAHTKVDLVDLYDRNPTSTDKKVDVDEAWLRFGREAEPATLPDRAFGAYLKVGKMPKPERQDDRHLESYGLVATAFNRFEDTGAELGVDLGRFLYVKASATQGNPVFMRDPNALAGDNGTVDPRTGTTDLPALGSGVVILYDAEVEDLDFGGDLELGGALGARWADASGEHGVDVMVFAYERELADTVDLEGTFYGGDLDLLLGPDDAFPLPLEGRDKEEIGANLWLYLGGFSLFAQGVDQDLAGLGRQGLEGELAWRFDLPLVWGVGGRQLFPSIAPAVRYSRLDHDFLTPRPTPAPSLDWDWEKWDLGVRLGIVAGVDLTAEWARNRFVLRSGATAENDELLVTLRWRS